VLRTMSDEKDISIFLQQPTSQWGKTDKQKSNRKTQVLWAEAKSCFNVVGGSTQCHSGNNYCLFSMHKALYSVPLS
jgi:hypothetical protein